MAHIRSGNINDNYVPSVSEISLFFFFFFLVAIIDAIEVFLGVRIEL